MPMEDCYYFLYSRCTKEICEFRHSLSAKENPILCRSWKLNKTCRKDCNFRHSSYHLNKKRSEEFCYWEKTSECTKMHCEFRHTDVKKDEWKVIRAKSFGENTSSGDNGMMHGNAQESLVKDWNNPFLKNTVTSIMSQYGNVPNDSRQSTSSVGYSDASGLSQQVNGHIDSKESNLSVGYSDASGLGQYIPFDSRQSTLNIGYRDASALSQYNNIPLDSGQSNLSEAGGLSQYNNIPLDSIRSNSFINNTSQCSNTNQILVPNLFVDNSKGQHGNINECIQQKQSIGLINNNANQSWNTNECIIQNNNNPFINNILNQSENKKVTPMANQFIDGNKIQYGNTSQFSTPIVGNDFNNHSVSQYGDTGGDVTTNNGNSFVNNTMNQYGPANLNLHPSQYINNTGPFLNANESPRSDLSNQFASSNMSQCINPSLVSNNSNPFTNNACQYVNTNLEIKSTGQGGNINQVTDSNKNNNFTDSSVYQYKNTFSVSNTNNPFLNSSMEPLSNTNMSEVLNEGDYLNQKESGVVEKLLGSNTQLINSKCDSNNVIIPGNDFKNQLNLQYASNILEKLKNTNSCNLLLNDITPNKNTLIDEKNIAEKLKHSPILNIKEIESQQPVESKNHNSDFKLITDSSNNHKNNYKVEPEFKFKRNDTIKSSLNAGPHILTPNKNINNASKSLNDANSEIDRPFNYIVETFPGMPDEGTLEFLPKNLYGNKSKANAIKNGSINLLEDSRIEQDNSNDFDENKNNIKYFDKDKNKINDFDKDKNKINYLDENNINDFDKDKNNPNDFDKNKNNADDFDEDKNVPSSKVEQILSYPESVEGNNSNKNKCLFKDDEKSEIISVSENNIINEKFEDNTPQNIKSQNYYKDLNSIKKLDGPEEIRSNYDITKKDISKKPDILNKSGSKIDMNIKKEDLGLEITADAILKDPKRFKWQDKIKFLEEELKSLKKRRLDRDDKAED